MEKYDGWSSSPTADQPQAPGKEENEEVLEREVTLEMVSVKIVREKVERKVIGEKVIREELSVQVSIRESTTGLYKGTSRPAQDRKGVSALYRRRTVLRNPAETKSVGVMWQVSQHDEQSGCAVPFQKSRQGTPNNTWRMSSTSTQDWVYERIALPSNWV